ncbi:Uncharacterized protein FWK35_00024934 [Aphis craccivora]|uniref:Uncharacterized protein n=1 Tax=Aphis craccivora TaxID=307492 RepID=A0A6G0ZBH3_APHCR|nr:Uncharacterized protein FWK35_00024934 [Aphis craccivora]
MCWGGGSCCKILTRKRCSAAPAIGGTAAFVVVVVVVVGVLISLSEPDTRPTLSGYRGIGEVSSGARAVTTVRVITKAIIMLLALRYSLAASTMHTCARTRACVITCQMMTNVTTTDVYPLLTLPRHNEVN